jgi:carboxyl-terminal processing protease
MYNNKRFFVYLPIAFALMLIAGFFLGATLVRNLPDNKSLLQGFKSQKYDPINDIISYIKQDYVDSVDVDALKRSAIEGIMTDLDPHSQYISAEEFNEVNDPLLGNFDGIGVQFRIEKDTVYIINTIPGGPSEKAGILAGDHIIKVEDKLIAGVKITNNEVMKLLKGERGTKVNISIARRGVKGLLVFEITRDVIPTYSVDIAFVPEPGIGYIKLSKFSATTSEEFNQALITLKSKGMKNLVLDLRGNSGGYLQAAINVADEFLPDGKLIVYTQGLNRPRQIANASKTGLFEKGNLVVLIDEGSASSSEIVAGALQDNDRAIIVGRRSFGKGLVQEQLSLPDGSAIRLTVARYYTPTGRSIQKPYENGHSDEYLEELHDRMVSGEFTSQDSIKFNDSLRYTTPGGRVVYGGGGIMPDVYVAVEKNEKYRYYNAIINKGLVYQFAFEYTDNNRKMLNSFKNFDDFNSKFSITPDIFQSFAAFVAKNGLEQDAAGMAFAKNDISNLMKALIARNIFDDKGFYPVYLKTDKTFLKAIEELKKMK